ncbi:type I restriction-modification system endonuclease [Mariniflexile sp. HNIBRBA6329]|uniref:type I restriction-modification system endonuclease n=1 Tax=Mariniflexile sp. HNIBRBA6329 TaxID=3373088 RepID=UPI003746278D
MGSTFSFLKSDYPELFTICEISEELIHIDPSSTLSKTRLLSEKIAALIWSFEDLGYFSGTQVDRINQLYYKNVLPEIIKGLLHTIRKSGNKATHDGTGSREEALFVLKKCFQLSKWFYETYNNDYVEIKEYVLPPNPQNNIEVLNTQLETLSKQVVDYKSKIESLNQNKQVTDARKRRGENNAKNLTLSEKDTRLLLIDPKLRLAGWECDTEILNYKTNKTLPEKGKMMAIAEWPCEGKWADYALFIGKTLYGIVEAKKYASDISTDLRQSKIYAERIEQRNDFEILNNWYGYKAPFLFSTNGRDYLEQLETKSGIWFLDIRNNRNRPSAKKGWFSPEGLIGLYEKDINEINERLEKSDYDYLQEKGGLSLRDYQINAIKAVENKLLTQPENPKSLLIMATGTGKTRTVIGLSYRFIKSNRFKRILFLTDRKLLALQAIANYKDNKIERLNTFGDVYQIDGLKDKNPDSDTRLHFATVQSMVKRLFYSENDTLPIDSYDCIIIDEAHRGYNLDREIDDEDIHFKDQEDYVSQYKRVIEYFNAYIIGLTATPALHTTQIFGNPVFSYSYRQAVLDGYLADHEPPNRIKTRLSEEGILWKKGERPKVFNPETNTIEELAELEDDLLIEIEQFNKLVLTESFNRTVCKELVKHLDPESDEKTLIFAVRDSHADDIVKILKEEFAEIGMDVHQNAIQKITGNVYDPEQLTKEYKNEKYPNIAVTVDLLTTGIDVPKICNLVFLRRVGSRILYEQMIGRATRKCDEIGKEAFNIYDAVRVHEALGDYTQMSSVAKPKVSFVQLVEELDFIDSDERTKSQIEQIIAKLQRKRNKIEEHTMEEFMYASNGLSPEDLIEKLQNLKASETKQIIKNYGSLWHYLDTKIYIPKNQLVSEHQDEFYGIERDYGTAKKPEDYIDNFKKFIEENKNKIAAIQVICNRPSSLDRASLKELKLLLDQEGYNARTLHAAWKNAKNEDIAADIISYIRTLALDVHLVSHKDRIDKAFETVYALKDWNKIQLKWLERFHAQLIAETVLSKEDLDKEPFKEEGGFKRINKIFENQLDAILKTINDNLYSA